MELGSRILTWTLASSSWTGFTRDRRDSHCWPRNDQTYLFLTEYLITSLLHFSFPFRAACLPLKKPKKICRTSAPSPTKQGSRSRRPYVLHGAWVPRRPSARQQSQGFP